MQSFPTDLEKFLHFSKKFLSWTAAKPCIGDNALNGGNDAAGKALEQMERLR